MKFSNVIKISSEYRKLSVRGWLMTTAIICLAVLSFASCSSDDDSVPDTSHDVTVTFTMSLGTPQTVTRAANRDWTDYDSIPGEGIENRVDLDRLSVLLYDNNGRYVSRVSNLVLRSIDSTTYQADGILRVDTLRLGSNYTFNGKMVVVANTDATPPVGQALTSGNVSGLSFDYTPGNSLDAIPMWGVQKLSNVSLAPGERVDLNEIWMLRAMAKINVNLTEDMTKRGYTLSKVTLNRYNTRGYVLPSGYNQVDNTRILNFDSGTALSFNPLLSVSTDSVDFTGKTIYLPEYDSSTTPTTLSVTIKGPDGSTRSASFEFANYANGNWSSPLNVVRNHAYVFNVYGNPIKIDLQVLPWTVFTHEEIVM